MISTYEIEQIAGALVRQGIISNGSDILKGKNASIKEIEYRFDKKKYNVLHYSGHNEFKINAQNENGLILAGKDTLTPALCIKIFQKHSPDFIFMNSCSTATRDGRNFLSRNPFSFIESFCQIDYHLKKSLINCHCRRVVREVQY